MNLKPIGDRIIVRREAAGEKTKGGLLLPDDLFPQPVEGVGVDGPVRRAVPFGAAREGVSPAGPVASRVAADDPPARTLRWMEGGLRGFHGSDLRCPVEGAAGRGGAAGCGAPVGRAGPATGSGAGGRSGTAGMPGRSNLFGAAGRSGLVGTAGCLGTAGCPGRSGAVGRRGGTGVTGCFGRSGMAGTVAGGA